MKTCNKCGETKDFSEFSKSKDKKDGHHSNCKDCIKERSKKLKESPLMQLEKAVRSSILAENKVLFSEGKRRCNLCDNSFSIKDYNRNCCRECIGKYYKKNKEKITEKAKEYREANRERARELNKAYREINREKINERNKEYQRQRRLKLKEGN